MTAPDHPWLPRCRAFAAEVIAPHHVRFDRENRFPDTIHEAAHDAGIINQDFPVALGGAGLDDELMVAGAEALATACAPTAFTLGVNRGALHPVLVAGNTDQKKVFVADLLAQRKYAALCLTEPEVSGSNLLGVESRAVRTDAGWLVSGIKSMVGNGGVASLYMVLARAEIEGRNAGLTFFAVPRGDGVSVSANPDKLGFRAVETPTVTLDQVEITDDHRVGEIGSGAELMIETLASIRVGGAAVITGLVVGALLDALPWVETRAVYGSTLLQKSHVQLQLGDLYGRLQAVRAMTREAATRRRTGAPYAEHAGIAKLHASTLAVDATAQIAQLFGWRGVVNDFPIQKRFRDARQTPIFEGTSEIQRLNLFRRLWARYRDTGDL